MNQLSWLLYLGNVASNLQGVFACLAFSILVAGVVLVIVHFTILIDLKEKVYGWPEVHHANALMKHLKRKPLGAILLLVLGIMCVILSALMPDRETVYAIAASQVGEQALKTPLASKAGQAVESWLDKQIAENQKK